MGGSPTSTKPAGVCDATAGTIYASAELPLHHILYTTITFCLVHETSTFHRSLARTIMQEDVTGLLRLVQKGACISDNDGHGWTPLHWACSRGSTVMTYAILQEIRLSQAKGEHSLVQPHMLLLL